MRPTATCLVIGCLFSAAASADTLYSIDDGTAERVRGGPAGVDGLIGNLFTAIDGGERIKTISVAWGSPEFPGHALPGTPIEVLLYDVSNDEGKVEDFTLLAAASGTIASPDSNTFVDYSIPPTVVSGRFFAAVIVPNLAGGPSPIATDDSSDAGATLAVLATAIDVTSISPAPLPMPGNAMVRAKGVPEPATIGLAIILLAGFAAERRLTARSSRRRP